MKTWHCLLELGQRDLELERPGRLLGQLSFLVLCYDRGARLSTFRQDELKVSQVLTDMKLTIH